MAYEVIVNRKSDVRVRVGFVPLVDCAPLIVAYEYGWFKEKGIHVELIRETGWASIRDKIVCDELDAAHAISGLCFALPWGLGAFKEDCLTGFLFNSNGNSIVLAEGLPKSLASIGRPMKFAIPHVFSSHHFLLKQWLKPLLVEGEGFEIITVSPLLMVDALQAGFIDGFCAGEPYGSLAVQKGIGSVAKESVELSAQHPEKALLVTKRFATQQEEVHLDLISCLLRAAEFCDSKTGRKKVGKLLARSCYLNLPQDLIEQSLMAPSKVIENPDYHVFSKGGVNDPAPAKASWIINHMRANNLIPPGIDQESVRIDDVFRTDIYQSAKNRS